MMTDARRLANDIRLKEAEQLSSSPRISSDGDDEDFIKIQLAVQTIFRTSLEIDHRHVWCDDD
jgi:hypothetical protein